MIVLVADDLGPLPETIRSRCQLVPFRRLSERAVREVVDARAPGLDEERGDRARARRRRAGSTAPSGCSTRRARAARGAARGARAVYLDPAFEPADGAAPLLDCAPPSAAPRRAREAEPIVEGLELTGREAEQRVRRAQRGAEREELLAALEELAAWYRDLVVVAAGAESAASTSTGSTELREDATRERLAGAERACELVRETWRALEEFNLDARSSRSRRCSSGCAGSWRANLAYES